ncbi:hypothetical protein JCM8547_001342 [Rhodosporidiobolus lusitaniae]
MTEPYPHPSLTADGKEGVPPEQVADGDFEQALDGLTHEPDEEPQGLDLHTPAAHGASHPWLRKLVPGIEKLAVGYHLGTYVAVGRGENPQKVWESMPIYVRIGMQALYHGREQASLLSTKRIENLLKNQSIKQGLAYDDPTNALQHIQAFVKTYAIDTSELLRPRLEEYKTFNEFFFRALRPGARPVANPEQVRTVSSAADCRLTVFDTVKEAQEFWIKGKKFTIPALLGDPQKAQQFEGGSIAIFRLAPADYHRYHSPVDAVVGETKSVEGTYYTVNPCAVNENLDVFTCNKRDITYLHVTLPSSSTSSSSTTSSTTSQTIPIAFVQIGAMLVGSIKRTVPQGESVKRGGELGYFAYGGSTVIALFPPGTVKFDEDLVRNSKAKLETAVRVGEQIGRFI